MKQLIPFGHQDATGFHPDNPPPKLTPATIKARRKMKLFWLVVSAMVVWLVVKLWK